MDSGPQQSQAPSGERPTLERGREADNEKPPPYSKSGSKQNQQVFGQSTHEQPAYGQSSPVPNAHRIVNDAAGSQHNAQQNLNFVLPPLLVKLWRETGKNKDTWWQTHPALWDQRVFPCPPGYLEWKDPFPVTEPARWQEIQGKQRGCWLGNQGVAPL
jgi:hypothetical protein